MSEVEIPFEDDLVKPLSLLLSGDVIEIDFFDPRRAKNGVAEFTKISFPKIKFDEEVEQLEILLRDLIDDVLRLRID